MKSNSARRLRKLAVLFVSVVLSACAEEGPPMLAHYPALPPPRPAAKPLERRQAAVPHVMAPIGPGGPSGPLVMARVGSYMDALEVTCAGTCTARGSPSFGSATTSQLSFATTGCLPRPARSAATTFWSRLARSWTVMSTRSCGSTASRIRPGRRIRTSPSPRGVLGPLPTLLCVKALRRNALLPRGLASHRLRIVTGDGKKEARNRRIEIVLKANPERTTATR